MRSVYNLTGAELLRQVEDDPNAFMPGRRNNDICNWYFAHKIALEEQGKNADFNDILRSFELMMNVRLRMDQCQSLNEWPVGYAAKLLTVHNYYQDKDRQYILDYLWID